MSTLIDKLEKVLNRTQPIESLDALSQALRPKTKASKNLATAAFALDSNIFLKLGSHKDRADVVDYLAEQHNGPLILASQSIQEFWNNQLSAVETVAAGLKKKFDAFKADVSKIDSKFGSFAEKIQEQLDLFSAEYGYLYDEKTLRNVTSIFEMLQKKARISFIPRNRFSEVCLHRKRTKTPPGFEDPGDGDFYIWAELLLGLMTAQEEKIAFDYVVFVTNDKKADWSRAGIIHPVLAAEVKAVVGTTIDVWSLEELVAEIKKLTSSPVTQVPSVVAAIADPPATPTEAPPVAPVVAPVVAPTPEAGG